MRHALFVQHYLQTKNATDAAKRAGYSAKTASVQGFRLLRDAKIQQLIEAETYASIDRLRLDRDHVLRQLARIGFGDIRRLFNADGSMKPVQELDDDAAAMVGSIEAVATTKTAKPAEGDDTTERPEETKTVTVKYRRVDPIKALHLLGIHHQVFKDQPTTNNFVQFIIED